MNEKILVAALQILSELLYKHYGQKTIILIDEYDVPLNKAFQYVSASKHGVVTCLDIPDIL